MKNNYIDRNTLYREYGIPYNKINHYFGKNAVTVIQNGHETIQWCRSEVEQLLEDGRILEEIRRDKEKKEARRSQRKAAYKKQLEDLKKENDQRAEIRKYLRSFSMESILEESKNSLHYYVLHVGPTNSGKTYDAIQALKKARTGVYLGPLRLLALEMYDKMNRDMCYCNLVTGEEKEVVPGATITASTIELCDYSLHYDVAVIDEAQMIADPDRGAHWTRAICCVDADETHICLAPEAEELICGILDMMNANYVVHHHERMVPLEFAGGYNVNTDIEPGDALIVFSRKSVLNVAAYLEKQNWKCSVIYGALPPAARRDEVRKLASGESDVVVATDAIGLGISLPIRRIIFAQTTKFDGHVSRLLNPAEIKQIAGRAGRYGIYDKGYVLAIENSQLIERALREPTESIQEVYIPFPKESLEQDYPLSMLLEEWTKLPPGTLIQRASQESELFLLKYLGKSVSGFSKSFIYDLISCPVDTKNENLVMYWTECAFAIMRDKPVPKPYFSTDSLEGCEAQYRAYDIYHQLLRRIGFEEDCQEEKAELCRKINRFLLEEKTDYVQKCSNCGRTLPMLYQYGVCQHCFRKMRNGWFV